jgi:hypothetical protein
MMLPPNHPSIVKDNKLMADYLKAHPEARDWKKGITPEEMAKMEAEMLK